MSHPRLVIFDNDGVLVDSERISNVVFAALITEHGLPTTFEESVALYMGKRTSDCVGLIEASLGRALPPDFVHQYERRCETVLRRELAPVDGARELVEALRTRGSDYCIASSGTPDEIALRLNLTGLASLFDANVYSASMVERGKPAPDLFLHAAASHAVEASDCVVIEDSTAGVTAARAAGMRVIGHAALASAERLRDAGADEVVTTMRDVPSLLGF
ncbi:HAD family hydrolase [Stackebrandtia soli]|uniref:HAD family hydrolase n=1 Tax=Stackebrandtia soli TaxID=1892856 RepID=UPI0039E8924E